MRSAIRARSRPSNAPGPPQAPDPRTRADAARAHCRFGRLSPTCIGCAACAQICPVQAIRIEDAEGERRVIVRGKEASRVPLRKCTGCGIRFGPVIDLSQVMQRAGEAGVPAFNTSVCPACSRRNLAKRMAERHFEQYQGEPRARDEED